MSNGPVVNYVEQERLALAGGSGEMAGGSGEMGSM